MGTCEPYVDAWAGGPIQFYAPAQGCDIQEEVCGHVFSVFLSESCLGVGVWFCFIVEGASRKERVRDKCFSFDPPASNLSPFVCWYPGPQQPPYAVENEAGRVRRRNLGTFQRPFLMAFDLSPHHADQNLKDDTTIRSAFPHKTLDVIERVRRVVNTIRPSHGTSNVENRASALQPHPVSMHIEHTPEEFCGVCGVDSLEGEGSARCAYQKSCDDAFVSTMSATATQLFDPASVQAAGPHRFTSIQQLLQGPDAAEARFAILASLDVITTAANSTPFDVAVLKDALSHSLGLPVDDPYYAVSGEEAVQVEVVRAAVDEMFAHMFADELRHEGGRRFLDEEGGEGGDEPIMMESQRHRVMLVTASQGKKEGILRSFGIDDPVQQASRRLWVLDKDQGPGTDSAHEIPGDAPNLAARIASFIHKHEGEALSSVERVEVRFERLLSIPANDAALGSGLGAFAPEFGEMAVLVTDPTMPREPLGAIVYGRTYRLEMEQFPPRTMVRVAALRAPGHGQEEDESDRARVLATIWTDEKGAATVPNLRFSSARLFPPGDYEIQALVPRTKAFGLSHLFTLSQEGPERKLFKRKHRL